MTRLLTQSEEVTSREAARAGERQQAEEAFQRRKHRVMWLCVALSFSGVPLFGLSIYLADDRQADLALAGALFLSYGAPFFCWLFYHVRSADQDS